MNSKPFLVLFLSLICLVLVEGEQIAQLSINNGSGHNHQQVGSISGFGPDQVPQISSNTGTGTSIQQAGNYRANRNKRGIVQQNTKSEATGQQIQYSKGSGGTDIIQQSTSNDGNLRQVAVNSGGGNIIQKRGDITFD